MDREESDEIHQAVQDMLSHGEVEELIVTLHRWTKLPWTDQSKKEMWDQMGRGLKQYQDKHPGFRSHLDEAISTSVEALPALLKGNPDPNDVYYHLSKRLSLMGIPREHECALRFTLKILDYGSITPGEEELLVQRVVANQKMKTSDLVRDVVARLHKRCATQEYGQEMLDIAVADRVTYVLTQLFADRKKHYSLSTMAREMAIEMTMQS